MEHEALVRRIEDRLLGPSGFRGGDRERALDTLGRFAAYLSARGIARIQDTTLEALQAYPFDLQKNDDGNLRLVFRLLGREDLLAFISMVSSEKYFRNKKLRVALAKVAEVQPYVASLRKANVRMAAELLDRGQRPMAGTFSRRRAVYQSRPYCRWCGAATSVA